MSSSDNNNSRKRGYSEIKLKSDDPPSKKHKISLNKTNQQKEKPNNEQDRFKVWLKKNFVKDSTIKKLTKEYHSMYVYIINVCF